MILGVIAAIVLAISVSACGGSSKKSSSSSSSSGGGKVVSGPGGTVTIRSIDDIDNLNPAKDGITNLDVTSLEMGYDRLIYLAPNGRLLPFMATRWRTTGTSTTFWIRHGATCDDGTPVTPSVIAASLRYEMAPNTTMITDLVGSGALKSVTSDNARGTVTVTLTKPFPGMLTGLAMISGSIICPRGLKHPSLMNSQTVGSGPYELDLSQSQRGASYTWKLRPNYDWGPDGWTAHTSGVPTKIVYRVVTDQTTAANLFITHALDIEDPVGINVKRVLGCGCYNFATKSLGAGSWAIVMNEAKGLPGADPRVRRAAFLALNGPLLEKAAFPIGQADPMPTILTPNMQDYDASVGRYTPGYDAALARKVLEQDGYKRGSNGMMTKAGKPLTLRLVNCTCSDPMAALMQTELGAAGIGATVQDEDLNGWVTALFTTHKYDISAYDYEGLSPNPTLVPDQDRVIIADPKLLALETAAEQAPLSAAESTWNRAWVWAETHYDWKPIGGQYQRWFARGWMFSAPFDYQAIDPFTLRRFQSS